MPGLSRPHARSRRLAAAVAVLLATAVTSCGADDAATGSSASPSESPSASLSESASPSASRSPSPSRTRSEPAGPVLDIDVSGDEVTPVGEQVDLAAGEPLVIRIRSDRAGELHVHADPEQYVGFTRGEEELELSFDNPGAIDIEEHDSGTLVARVLVR